MSSNENADIRELRGRLDEAKEALEAIYHGAVDAVVVMGLNGPQIFTLKNADEPYRILVERMNEGALTLSPEGIILYGNAHFSKLIGRPLEHIVGKPLAAFLPEENSEIVEALLKEKIKGVLQRELSVVRKDGSEVPTVASVGPLRLDESSALVVTLTDISERKR